MGRLVDLYERRVWKLFIQLLVNWLYLYVYAADKLLKLGFFWKTRGSVEPYRSPDSHPVNPYILKRVCENSFQFSQHSVWLWEHPSFERSFIKTIKPFWWIFFFFFFFLGGGEGGRMGGGGGVEGWEGGTSSLQAILLNGCLSSCIGFEVNSQGVHEDSILIINNMRNGDTAKPKTEKWKFQNPTTRPLKLQDSCPEQF